MTHAALGVTLKSATRRRRRRCRRRLALRRRLERRRDVAAARTCRMFGSSPRPLLLYMPLPVYSTESTVSACDTIVYFMNFDVWGVESHPQGGRGPESERACPTTLETTQL